MHRFACKCQGRQWKLEYLANLIFKASMKLKAKKRVLSDRTDLDIEQTTIDN